MYKFKIISFSNFLLIIFLNYNIYLNDDLIIYIAGLLLYY